MKTYKYFILFLIFGVVNFGYSQTVNLGLEHEIDSVNEGVLTQDQDGVVEIGICREKSLRIKPNLINNTNGSTIVSTTISIFRDSNEDNPHVTGASCPNNIPDYYLVDQEIQNNSWFNILEHFNNISGFCRTNLVGDASDQGSYFNPNFNTFFIRCTLNTGEEISTKFKLSRYSSNVVNEISESDFYEVNNNLDIPTLTGNDSCRELKLNYITLKYNNVIDTNVYTYNNYFIEYKEELNDLFTVNDSNTVYVGYYRFTLISSTMNPSTIFCDERPSFVIHVTSLGEYTQPENLFNTSTYPDYEICDINSLNNSTQTYTSNFSINSNLVESNPFILRIELLRNSIADSNNYPFYQYRRTYSESLELSNDPNNDAYYVIDNSSNTFQVEIKHSYLYNLVENSEFLTNDKIRITIRYNDGQNTCIDSKFVSVNLNLIKKFITPFRQNYLLQDFTNGSDLDEDGITDENELTTKTIKQLFENYQKDNLYYPNPYPSYYDINMFELINDEYLEITPNDDVILDLYNWEENTSQESFNRKTYYFDIDYNTSTGCNGMVAEKIPFDIGIFDIYPTEQTNNINPSIMEVCGDGDQITVDELPIVIHQENDGFLVYENQFGGEPLDGATVLIDGNEYFIAEFGDLEANLFDGYYPTLQNNLISQSAKRIKIKIIYNCCPNPLELEEFNNTNTTITINWTPTGNETQWEILYGFSGTVNTNTGDGISITVNAHPFTITNLIPANNYEFYVRAICTDDESEWIGPLDATTDCSNCTSFIPEQDKEYIIDAWVKEDHTSVTTVTTEANRDDIELMLNDLISNYDPNNPLSNTYVNQGLQNLINSGSINQNIVNPTIYNFVYDAINNQFQFQFGDGLHVQTFDAGCIVIVGNPPSFGQIVDVTPNANNDPNIFTLGVDCDGDGIKEYLKNYEFGLATYMANVTTITNQQVMTYSNVYVQLTFLDNADSIIPDFTGEPNRKYYPNLTGDIIDGWQRIHGIFKVPVGTIKIKIELVNDHVNDAYFDDVRIFPVDGNMKSFVYDQQTQRLMAELDENNYATFYEYDKEGGLIRVKKETEKGVFTIQETRSGNVKKD